MLPFIALNDHIVHGGQQHVRSIQCTEAGINGLAFFNTSSLATMENSEMRLTLFTAELGILCVFARKMRFFI